jgi:hypothetical protein
MRLAKKLCGTHHVRYGPGLIKITKDNQTVGYVDPAVIDAMPRQRTFVTWIFGVRFLLWYPAKVENFAKCFGLMDQSQER